MICKKNNRTSKEPSLSGRFFCLYGLFRSAHLDALLGAGAYAGAAFNAL